MTREKLIEKECKVCCSRKWVCFTDNYGKDWYCWGHRPKATEQERKREDDRDKNVQRVRERKPEVKKNKLDEFF